MPQNVFDARETHNRILDGFSARPERAVLNWLTPRVPKSISPNHLTALGVFGAVCVCIGAALTNISTGFLYLAIAGLFLNWLGDSLDGTVARFRKIERPRYGFFVDHVSDVASQILIVLGLGLSPYLQFPVILVTLVAYLAITIYSLVKLHVSRTMQLSYFGVGPTEIRILVGAGMVATLFVEPIPVSTQLGDLTVFDFAAIGVSVFALGCAVVMFVKDAQEISRLDPVRGKGSASEVSMITLESGGPSARQS
ncbi:CDP-alcohol phosphatidyltransferase family protein [Hyphomicrobium sp. 2TAF46]|uniref:CDP-alcohol phosphatidyltransferase family protein n=1 Tax=Hyphomicrobium sp. 2TAF46 TaxID=3233019 RepID=UPI003F8DCE10